MTAREAVQDPNNAEALFCFCQGFYSEIETARHTAEISLAEFVLRFHPSEFLSYLASWQG